MIDPEQFEARIDRIARLNQLDRKTAGEAVAIMGDTPERDEQGRAVVTLDDGRVLHLITRETES